MSTIDTVVSAVIFIAFIGIIHYAKHRIWPADKSAADMGYAPGSERIPASAVLGAVAFIALAGFVLWAGVIVGL